MKTLYGFTLLYVLLLLFACNSGENEIVDPVDPPNILR